jgi:two-component system nitrogen regulation response regulator GlnG
MTDPSPPRVLLAEDDASLRLVLGKALARRDLRVTQAENGGEARRLLLAEPWDVAVFDVRMPVLTGLDLLPVVQALPDPPRVVVITAQDTMENAISAMKGGAFEYLCKPFDVDEFVDLVVRAAGSGSPTQGPRERIDDGRANAPETRTLFGRSPGMQRVFKAIGRAAPSPHVVLILGESGTGKELVARILHRESTRARGPFVAINAAAIPAELLEAELFGHARGAFTGAQAPREGKFAAAQGGTLFLDEIGELSLGVQAKLLRVLQEKEFHPVGSDRPSRVDARVIAATHRDLAEDVRAGRFRADLFYRLHVLTIELPPLRDRKADIPQLATWLLERHAREGSIPRKALSEDAIAWLLDYTWPGNVRELENTLLRAATFAHGAVVEARDLLDPMVAERRRLGGQNESFEDWLRARLGPLVRSFPEPSATAPSDLHALVVGTAERVLLDLALQRTGGNQLRASELLGLHRNTLRRRMDELGLEAKRSR